MGQIDCLLDEMELAGPRERAIFEAALNGATLDQASGHPINENLSSSDLELIDALVKRFDRLIKGGLLVSFLALRQQIKAIQKEIAEMRKHDDKDTRKLEKIETQMGKLVDQANKTNKKIDDIADLIDKLVDDKSRP